MMIELELDIGTTCVSVLVCRSDRSFPARAGDCDALIPLGLFPRPAINLKHNALVVYNNVADSRLVPRFHGGSKHRQHRLQSLAARCDNAIAQARTLLSHGKWGANVDQLCIERSNHN